MRGTHSVSVGSGTCMVRAADARHSGKQKELDQGSRPHAVRCNVRAAQSRSSTLCARKQSRRTKQEVGQMSVCGGAGGGRGGCGGRGEGGGLGGGGYAQRGQGGQVKAVVGGAGGGSLLLAGGGGARRPGGGGRSGCMGLNCGLARGLGGGRFGGGGGRGGCLGHCIRRQESRNTSGTRRASLAGRCVRLPVRAIQGSQRFLPAEPGTLRSHPSPRPLTTGGGQFAGGGHFAGGGAFAGGGRPFVPSGSHGG